MADGILYLPDGQSGVLGEHGCGFQIVDAANLAKLIIVDFYNLPDGGASKIEVVGENGVLDPVGWFETPKAVWGITAVSNNLYAFDQDAGIYVLDVSVTALKEQLEGKTYNK